MGDLHVHGQRKGNRYEYRVMDKLRKGSFDRRENSPSFPVYDQKKRYSSIPGRGYLFSTE